MPALDDTAGPGSSTAGRLDGRVAVVTGAGQGVGEGIVSSFLRGGTIMLDGGTTTLR